MHVYGRDYVKGDWRRLLPQFVPVCENISAALLVLVHQPLLTTLLSADLISPQR